MQNEHGNGNHDDILSIKSVQIIYICERRNKLKAISSVLSKLYSANEHLIFFILIKKKKTRSFIFELLKY